MNMIPMIREALGLEIEEEFQLVKSNGATYNSKYRFADNDKLQWFDPYTSCWNVSSLTMLEKIIYGLATIKKLPFKPKTGEDYYFVDVSTGYVCRTTYGLGYRHDVVRIRDALRVSSGNCYQTEEEAEKHIDEWMEKLYGKEWRNLYEPDTDD